MQSEKYIGYSGAQGAGLYTLFECVNNGLLILDKDAEFVDPGTLRFRGGHHLTDDELLYFKDDGGEEKRDLLKDAIRRMRYERGGNFPYKINWI